ncbi:hypothetical protein FTO74_15690 [Granulicella sp. WH15]|uniref:hypothetical protein n=1 Tax=Granulicella sp. WH15 TaxID=2602070 RepID=UPI001366B432|nr:hypothetical protein [Granulicella sp. WH15]QHN04643.1 hypothetical protein FTO74_15690 [Granulicella sp. WH15]
MLDVHPPHGATHSWRDFFIHIVTITIGLLIALSLEGTVEWLHHRHIVHEARENIRREIEQNDKAAKENLGYLQENIDNVDANVVKIRSLRTDKNALNNSELLFRFRWSDLSDSAWRSARDTGALALMPTEEVTRYAESYGLQELALHQEVTTLVYETELAAPLMVEKDPAALNPEDVHELLKGAAITTIRLSTLKQLVMQLEKSYAELLQKQAA